MSGLRVECPHCHAAVGQPCTIPGTQQRLSLSPAHPSRLERAGMTPAYSAVERYRDRHRPTDTANKEQDAEN